VQHKWSNFLTFAFISRSRECIHSTSARSVSQHHGKSTECMRCAFNHFCYVGACKFGVCWFSLLYLSHFMVHTTRFLMYQAFTNMGQPMHWWLHLKYHFMWSGPCTVRLGIGVVFAFSFLACMLVFILSLHACLFSCLCVCLLAFISLLLLLLLCSSCFAYYFFYVCFVFLIYYYICFWK